MKRGLNGSTKTLMIETDEAAKSPPTTVRSVLEPRFRSVKRGARIRDGRVAVIQVRLKPGDLKAQGRKILRMVRREYTPTG